MKETFYFSHDANARNDEKVLELRDQFGWAGYGMYWAIIELLRDSPDYTLSKSMAMLKQCLNITTEEAEQFLSKCLALGLFVEKNGRFYSESLMKRMESIDQKRAKRAEAGRKGGNAKAMLKQNVANKVKENKVKENKILIGTDEFKNAFESFVEMRRLIKKPLTQTAKELIILNLKKLASGDEKKQILILEQSVRNSWQDVYELKEDKKNGTGTITTNKKPHEGIAGESIEVLRRIIDSGGG